MATPTFKFRLLANRKYRERGTRYRGPCVVESIHDNLDELFPDSFERIEDKKEENSPSIVPVDFKRSDSVKREKAKKDQAKFGEDEQYSAPKFEKVHRGRGKYNVIEKTTGKVLNGRLLTKEEADTLCGKANHVNQ